MRWAVEKDADTEAKNKYGQTALAEGVKNRQEAVVRELLKNGANFNTQTDDGKMPLHWALIRVDEESDENEFSDGNEAVVLLLIENGADVAAMDKGGRTVLHEAAKNGYDIVVQLLLESLDVNAMTY